MRKDFSEYQKRFLESRDPEVVVEFIRKTKHALREPWVIDEVMRWDYFGENELIKRAFLPHKGERPDKYKQVRLGFLLMQRVDRLVSKGMTKKEAFKKVEPPGGVYLDPKTIRNKYYRAKRRKPRIYVTRTPTTLTISAFPAKCAISVGDQTASLFGEWKISISL